jgi:cell division protein FtsI (penicillin-binding protein 3)
MLVDQRKRNGSARGRTRFCCACLQVLVLFGFGALVAKAFTLQVVEYPSWEERARAQTETTVKVPIYRGSIYDRRGRLLALSVPQQSVFADGAMVGNTHKAAAQLAPILGVPAASLQAKLGRQKRFIWLKRELADQQANILAELNLPGIHLVDEYRRFYPYRQIAGQLLGFVGADGAGLEGVEKNYDQDLRERFHAAGQQRDGLRKRLAFDCEPVLSHNERPGLSLTLDVFLQYLAERELEEAIKKYRARAGEVVIIDTQRFEVLAMANWPPFNPNTYRQEQADTWRNRTITDHFEPGSTFKVFLVAGALEEGLVGARDRIFCENGKFRLANHTINDVHPYGWLTIPELIKYSSNIGATKLATQMGIERYYRYIKAFGFGERTGIDLPAEAKGSVRPWKKWRPVDLAAMGFGQSLGVTTLQLTLGVACIANGGSWMQPIMVRGTIDQQGALISQGTQRKLQQVIRKKTANQVRDMMVEVTKPGGTGIQAAINGYTVAGKTGTAQMLDPGSHHYSSNKYTSVFTGFAPAENARIAMTVVIHEPHGAIYGGVVAAPVFRDVAAQALPYLGVAPSGDELGAPAPVANVVQAAATPKLLALTVPGRAKAGPQGDAGGESKLELTGANLVESGLMPNVIGQSLKIALQRLQRLDGKVKLEGSGQVVGQFPLPGTPVSAGDTIELVLDSMSQVAATER